MSENYYDQGNWNVICDICGKKRKRSQCKKTWDGFLACTVEKCFYTKHPNDYPRRIVPDGLPVPDARPRPDLVSEMSSIPVPGITRWTDTGLRWNTQNWRWDDDTSKQVQFNNGDIIV